MTRTLLLSRVFVVATQRAAYDLDCVNSDIRGILAYHQRGQHLLKLCMEGNADSLATMLKDELGIAGARGVNRQGGVPLLGWTPPAGEPDPDTASTSLELTVYSDANGRNRQDDDSSSVWSDSSSWYNRNSGKHAYKSAALTMSFTSGQRTVSSASSTYTLKGRSGERAVISPLQVRSRQA